MGIFPKPWIVLNFIYTMFFFYTCTPFHLKEHFSASLGISELPASLPLYFEDIIK